MSFVRNLTDKTTSIIRAAWRGFDIGDVFVFGGLAALGAGIDLRFGLWLALVVCGAAALVIGCAIMFSAGKG